SNSQAGLSVFWGQSVTYVAFSPQPTAAAEGAEGAEGAEPQPNVAATGPSDLYPVSVAATQDGSGNPVYYAGLSDGNLYASPSSQEFSWPNQLSGQDPASQSVSLASVEAWSDSGGGQHVLVVGANHRLYDYDALDPQASLVDLGFVIGQVTGGHRLNVP